MHIMSACVQSQRDTGSIQVYRESTKYRRGKNKKVENFQVFLYREIEKDMFFF